jgi:hypothetical protein
MLDDLLLVGSAFIKKLNFSGHAVMDGYAYETRNIWVMDSSVKRPEIVGTNDSGSHKTFYLSAHSTRTSSQHGVEKKWIPGPLYL